VPRSPTQAGLSRGGASLSLPNLQHGGGLTDSRESSPGLPKRSRDSSPKQGQASQTASPLLATGSLLSTGSLLPHRSATMRSTGSLSTGSLVRATSIAAAGGRMPRQDLLTQLLRSSSKPASFGEERHHDVVMGSPPLMPRCIGYEDACRDRKILPKFARAARDGRHGEELDLCNLGLGDLQLEALLLDPVLVPLAKIFVWRVRDGRISNRGLVALADAFPTGTKIVDLARNEIGLKGMDALAGVMSNMLLLKLRRIDLSANAIRNDTAASLARGLEGCPVLLRLELNHNEIQDGAALGRLAAEHMNLTRLSLHCNRLTGAGTAALFRGVLLNSRNGGRLADIDVAWNAMADADAAACASAIGDVFRESVTLYHLDLSYNGLDAAACALLGEGLRDNHHLFGLHLVGNAAVIDADGFLSPVDKSTIPGVALAQEGSRPAALKFNDPRNGAASRVGGTESKGSSPGLTLRSTTRSLGKLTPWTDDEVLRERDVLEQTTTCWACEGWERVSLEWPIVPGEPAPRAVWVFTSLDGFQGGLRMSREHGPPPRFVAARMAPAGCQLSAIFQVDSALRVAPGMEVEKLPAPVEIELRACKELPELQPPPDQEIAHCTEKAKSKTVLEHRFVLRSATAGVVDRAAHVLPPTCSGPVGRRTVLLSGPGGAGTVQMCRVTETEFRMHTKRKRSNAFFFGFKKETDAVVKECLALDWARAKVNRIVAEAEILEVQDVLRENYHRFLAIYRNISAVGVSGETGFGVSQIEASDLIASAGLIDGSTRISDVDRLFIAAKVVPHDQKRGMVRQDKALVRHQCLELFLRLAYQKYVQTGKTASIADAVRRVFSALEGIGDKRVTERDLFFKTLHTEAVDDVYKRHLGMAQDVFRRFSGRYTPPGKPTFMSLAEFQEILEQIDAYDAEFMPRRSAYAYRLGMMTQPEEFSESRFQEMTFQEFQHAVGAVVFLRAHFEPDKMADLVDGFFSERLARALQERKASKSPKRGRSKEASGTRR